MTKNLILSLILQIFYLGLVLFLNKLRLNDFINIASMSFVLGICSHYFLDAWLFKIMGLIGLSALFIFLNSYLLLAVMLSCYFLALTLAQFKSSYGTKKQYELHPH
ncbi:hypothetical protein DJ533_18505 [Acinetobacter defluvii]|uniref:Uncharacterized protein n=2 Tax=Acinetobacter defluvii TaxID=1871111 RepID=A0A2S2FHF2_9GAMM|nr:hypothetical protein DJ533_18505 [Acinetobacter defluvii]